MACDGDDLFLCLGRAGKRRYCVSWCTMMIELVKYPVFLCRPPPTVHERRHLAHVMLVSLAAVGDPRAQAMYDKLRGSYNSFRPSASRPVPPLEEWHGVDVFCDDLYCRAVDLQRVASRLQTSWASPVGSIDVCVGTKGADSEQGEKALQGHWETQSDTLSACDVAEKTIGTAVPACPTEGEAEYCMGSILVSTAPSASPVSSNNPWCHLKTGLHSDRGSNKVDSTVITPESLPRSPEVGEGSGAVEDTEDDISSIGAGNWLDVTHAELDKL
ncbi:unnamed protein product [Ectocarpus fasciculatus]